MLSLVSVFKSNSIFRYIQFSTLYMLISCQSNVFKFAYSLHGNDTGLDKMCTQNANAEAKAKKNRKNIFHSHRSIVLSLFLIFYFLRIQFPEKKVHCWSFHGYGAQQIKWTFFSVIFLKTDFINWKWARNETKWMKRNKNGTWLTFMMIVSCSFVWICMITKYALILKKKAMHRIPIEWNENVVNISMTILTIKLAFAQRFSLQIAYYGKRSKITLLVIVCLILAFVMTNTYCSEFSHKKQTLIL